MRINVNEENDNYMVTTFKGVLISIAISIICIIVLAVILTYTSLSENVVPILNSIIMIVSIALGAIYTSVKIKKKGWLNGAIIGLLYFILLILVSYIFIRSYKINSHVIIKGIVAIITGAVGGMIGVNLK
ncbi:TIGR04086 family membrane protein [Caloranaerobacter azorensis]|uniref:TIGR04086 family membrane protein n=2 Tax=Caloranaerobacter azorensis TaxID=116090 RepID=A0A6P1YCB1_9FIRM|nr:TIGR04086 family membrane protein [Caloranaerobacter azorensis]QIB26542.1 TIGR04086 family membrane protein [Caloranaerobacter azorensis]SHH53180.1 putative membrane protein, TIGR04086 family [Caloranaerobacter azorensis DSM 13643]